MKTPRARVGLLGVGALVVAGAAVHNEATPKTDSLYLKPPGSPDHESSMRPVCAGLLSISRTTAGWHPEAWIVVQNGSALYSEIGSARELYFETDPGSGLSHVCVADEVSYRDRPDLVNAVVATCKPKISFGRSEGEAENQIVLHLAHNLNGNCEKPGGIPTIVTPSNQPLRSDGASPAAERLYR
jgi:hypothetical protein